MNYTFETKEAKNFCGTYRQLVINFSLFKLIIEADGSYEVVPQLEGGDESTLKTVSYGSHTALFNDYSLSGAQYYPHIEELGYTRQDEITRTFANVESAALHLLVDEMRKDSFLGKSFASPFALTVARMFLTDDLRGIADDVPVDEQVENLFVAGIQALANGLQITKESGLDSVVLASGALGIKSSQSIIAALVFVNSLRSYLRLELG